MATVAAKQKVTIRLPVELIEASQEAVRLGLAASPSEFIEEAVRQRAREVRHARLRELAREAMNDPDFVADMKETMQAFRFADADSGASAGEQPAPCCTSGAFSLPISNRLSGASRGAAGLFSWFPPNR